MNVKTHSEHTLVRLTKILTRRTIPHALLFTGSSEEDLKQQAYAFVEKLFSLHDPEGRHLAKLRSGNHPDLHHYHPEGKTGMHSIQSLRALGEETAYAPHEAKWQCFLIFHADRMLPTSSNALLKTLEEPPPNTVFILMTLFPDRVLPTILSRCQRFSFGSPSSSFVGTLQDKLLAHMPDQLTSSLAEEIAEELDEEKKVWEKELRHLLSSDLSPLQREAVEKEIEGVISLRYQEKINQLLHLFLYWYRDRFSLEIKLPKELLLYPDRLSQLQKTPFLPLPYVEESLKQVRLAAERGMKLQTSLEALFIKLHF